MSLDAGLSFWRKHRRKLAWFAGALSLLGPAPGREGFDLAYPLVRLFAGFLTMPTDGLSLSEVSILAAIWGISWTIYFLIVLGAITVLTVVMIGITSSAPEADEPRP
jgi:hypothetical protein